MIRRREPDLSNSFPQMTSCEETRPGQLVTLAEALGGLEHPVIRYQHSDGRRSCVDLVDFHHSLIIVIKLL